MSRRHFTFSKFPGQQEGMRRVVGEETCGLQVVGSRRHRRKYLKIGDKASKIFQSPVGLRPKASGESP